MNYDELERIKRSQFKNFLDITPSSTATWKLEGVGVSEAGIDYNPSSEREKWIIEDNARTDHTDNQKTTSISKKTYKGDPVFEFVNAGRDKLNYKTHILEVDSWNGTGNTYPAKYSNGTILITHYEGSQIEYDLNYDGDPVEGIVTFDSNGVPTFTQSASV